MKYTLEFFPDRHEDRAAFKRAIKADAAYQALREIADNIFRPARKWGYPDTKSGVLSVDSWSEQTHEVVEQLEEMFYEIIREQEINLYEE